MYELNMVAVEVGDIGSIVVACEVDAICRFVFVDAPGFDCSRVGGINQFIRVADEPEVESGFAALTLTKPDANIASSQSTAG